MEVYEGGKSYYYHADGLGSVVALTKSTGTAANTYFGYNTFGGMPNPSESVANPFRYTGRDWDAETGLYYYRARYYDSLFGRFISEDPLGLGGGSNVYQYAEDDPVDFSDPEGLRATVTQNGDVINVDTTITIYGPRASAQLAATWQRIINNTWNRNNNNFHVGRCRVIFHVNVSADPAHNKRAQATPADNYVYARPRGFRSWTSRRGGTQGEWAVDDRWAAAHEAGHLFGLRDDYHDVPDLGSVPNPGHAGHMMGDVQGRVVQHEINDILNFYQCRCQAAAH